MAEVRTCLSCLRIPWTFSKMLWALTARIVHQWHLVGTCGKQIDPTIAIHSLTAWMVFEWPHLMSRTSRSTPSRSGNFMAVPPWAPWTCQGIWASYRMNHWFRFCIIVYTAYVLWYEIDMICSTSSQSSALSLLTFTILINLLHKFIHIIILMSKCDEFYSIYRLPFSVFSGLLRELLPFGRELLAVAAPESSPNRRSS